jgi:hypothetical protein
MSLGVAAIAALYGSLVMYVDLVSSAESLYLTVFSTLPIELIGYGLSEFLPVAMSKS